MRHGITILTDLPWAQATSRWSAAEEMGFAHGWTYDHLTWEGLPDSAWAAAMPTLAAAATVTSRMRLATFVATPNFRHPYPFLREIAAVDDISGGRFIAGLGLGGDLDARLLGDPLPLRDRAARYEEFVRLLDRLLREDHITTEGEWFSVREVRTLPGPLRPRVPLALAGNGPKAVRLAAELGDAWVTYGGRADTLDQWWVLVAELAQRFAAAEAAAGRSGVARVLSMDSSPQFSLASPDVYEEMAGRAGELGFTDVVCHWPRPSGPYAGSEAVLHEVAGRIDLGGAEPMWGADVPLSGGQDQ